MKLKDCKRGMELRPFEECDMYPLCGRLIISEVVTPNSTNDPRIPGIRFEGIHGTFRPECFFVLKKPDELEEGDYFLGAAEYEYKVLAKENDRNEDLIKYLVRDTRFGSVRLKSEIDVRRGTILYEKGKNNELH